MSNSLSPLVAISSSPSTNTVVSPTAEEPARPVAVQQEMSAALPSALLQPAADPSTSHQPPVSLTATSPLSPSKFTRFVHLFNPSTSPSSSVEALAEGTRAQGVTYSSLSGRRGSRSSGEQTYSTRARSGTWDSSGGIGESPHSQGRSSWAVSTAASSASALFAPSMHRPSTELQSRARSSSLSRTQSNTSSSASSSADYLHTPAQPAGQIYEPRIVREGERSPWSTGSSEGRKGKREPAMVDPSFQFPMKRGSIGQATTGLGLGVTSAPPERSAASTQAGSYVASLGLAPLVDDQGNPLALYPSTSPRLSPGSPELSSGSPSPVSFPLPPSSPPPTSPNKTRLLSAFQPSSRPSSSSTATATPGRSSPGRTSPKRKGKKQKHRGGSSSVGLLGQSLRHRRRSSASGSSSSTDRPRSTAMRPSPSAPNLLIHSPSSPPRPSASTTLPRTRPLATPSRPGIARSTSFSHSSPSSSSTPHFSTTPAHAPISTCEAYIFPRPRLAPPPSSPPLPSAKSLQAEWKRRQRGADVKGKGKALAQEEEDDLSLRRVMRENEESRRERANWSDSGMHSLGFGMGRKLSLSSRGRRARSVSRSRGSFRSSLPDSEWEAESNRQLDEIRLRRRKMAEKEERRRVRKEREGELKKRAEEGSDTEVEGEGGANRDEGGYLNPFYSPPTVHSFDPFMQGGRRPFKSLARRLSESRSKSRERRGSEAGLGGESDGAGAVSDGGKRRRKPSWSTSARRRGGSLAPLPPLPGLANSPSLGDFRSHQPHASTSTTHDLDFSSSHGLRYVGNRPIRHLRASPSLDSLSSRASAHARQQHQGPTAMQYQYGEALTDLNGSSSLHRSSGGARAATLIKQNAAVSLPPHLHHLLRSPDAPTTRPQEEEDTSFIPSRAPPPVPASVASLRTAATQGSPRSKASGETVDSERDRMSESSATELYVVAERKLAGGGAEEQGVERKAEKENAQPPHPISRSQQPVFPLQPSTVAPLAWRARHRSPSLDSTPHFSDHPYSQSTYTRSTAAPAPSSTFLPFPTQPNPPYARRRRSPTQPAATTEPLHSGSLPPPQRLHRVRPSLDASPSLSLASLSSNEHPVAPRAPLDEDLTTSLGPNAQAMMGVMDTPTLGAGRSQVGPGYGEYFSLPVDEPPSAILGSLALATTEEDPFARSQRPRRSIDTPSSAGSGKSYEGHVYGAGAGVGDGAGIGPQPPMESPESARSSGGESGMLNLDEGEWSFDNLFFRPPPTIADRSVLPLPTPIEMHRLSSSSRLTTTPTSSDDGRHTLLISPSSTYERDLVAEPAREQRHSIGEESLEGHRRSWTASETSVYSAGEDPTFGRRVGGDLRLSLDDVYRYSQSTARAFDGHAAEEEDDRPSTRASETWATAEDGGDEDDEDEDQRSPASPSTHLDDLPTPSVRPSPTPAQGDWTATSFAREYLGSTDSLPPSRTHSAPADQLSFIDFTTVRDSRQTLTSPTPTRLSNRSSGSGRGSFLEFGDGDSPPRAAQDQREVESRSSFLDEWSPPASPTESAPLSFPVILATSSSDHGHAEAPSSPPRHPHSPFSIDEGRFSDEPAQGRESYLSVDSPRSALAARNSSGTLSSQTGEIGTGTGGSSPMAASFHSHFSKLDDFPSPPPGDAEPLHRPPHRSSLHPLDRTRDSTQSLRRPRSMPQVPPSPPRANGAATKRRSSSFLDLYEETSRPLSTATSSPIYSRPHSHHSSSKSSASLRPWSTSQASFATFFSGSGASGR